MSNPVGPSKPQLEHAVATLEAGQILSRAQAQRMRDQISSPAAQPAAGFSGTKRLILESVAGILLAASLFVVLIPLDVQLDRVAITCLVFGVLGTLMAHVLPMLGDRAPSGMMHVASMTWLLFAAGIASFELAWAWGAALACGIMALVLHYVTKGWPVHRAFGPAIAAGLLALFVFNHRLDLDFEPASWLFLAGTLVLGAALSKFVHKSHEFYPASASGLVAATIGLIILITSYDIRFEEMYPLIVLLWGLAWMTAGIFYFREGVSFTGGAIASISAVVFAFMVGGWIVGLLVLLALAGLLLFLGLRKEKE